MERKESNTNAGGGDGVGRFSYYKGPISNVSPHGEPVDLQWLLEATRAGINAEYFETKHDEAGVEALQLTVKDIETAERMVEQSGGWARLRITRKPVGPSSNWRGSVGSAASTTPPYACNRCNPKSRAPP